MKKLVLSYVVIASFSLNTASAEAYTGIVQTLHYNASSDTALQERGVCIKLAPPADTAWKCMYKTNHLYKEIHSLFVMSKMMKKPVVVTTETGNWNIWAAEMN